MSTAEDTTVDNASATTTTDETTYADTTVADVTDSNTETTTETVTEVAEETTADTTDTTSTVTTGDVASSTTTEEEEDNDVIYTLKDCVWDNAEHTSFSGMVLHKVMGWIPYTFTANDKGYGKSAWDAQDTIIIAEYQPPEVTLAEAITTKLAEISAAGVTAHSKGVAYIISSVSAMKIDADDNAIRDITGLITIKKDGDDVYFRTFDNEIVKIEYANLATLLSECYINGQNLYNQKAIMEATTRACTTAAEASAVVVTYTQTDFSK